MEFDSNKYFENIENETKIDNMFFGDDVHKIQLGNIYIEAKKMTAGDEQIFSWHNNYTIKLAKNDDGILLNIDI